jgi:hypothetical protein
MDAEAFLDESVKKLMEEAWVPVPDPDRKQRSFVRTQDGQSWRFVMTLAPASEPSSYQLTLAVRHQIAQKKAKSSKG